MDVNAQDVKDVRIYCCELKCLFNRRPLGRKHWHFLLDFPNGDSVVLQDFTSQQLAGALVKAIIPTIDQPGDEEANASLRRMFSEAISRTGAPEYTVADAPRDVLAVMANLSEDDLAYIRLGLKDHRFFFPPLRLDVIPYSLINHSYEPERKITEARE